MEEGSGVADKKGPNDECHRIGEQGCEHWRYLKCLHVKSLRRKELQAICIQIDGVYTV
jgi:hypothetical protein